MAANYLHGVETIEVENGPRPITVVKSAVIGLVGTAPMGAVNELTLCLSEKNGAQFGTKHPDFTIPYALKAIYDHGAGTVLVINVLNPDKHRTETLNHKTSFDLNEQVILPNPSIQSVTIKYQGVDCKKDIDYALDGEKGIITRIADGSIPANGEIDIDFIFTDPSKVTAADIIGGISSAGKRTGLALLDESYNLFGFFAKLLIAPGYSPLNSVSTELISVAGKSGAMALIDAPIGTTFAQAIAGRGPTSEINFNTSSERAILCYPHLKAYDSYTDSNRLEPMSQRLAGLMAAKDLEKGYWWSPSNTEIKGIVGAEFNLTAQIDDPNSEVNLLNEKGIMTVFNSYGTGLRAWGNRSATYPTVTHMKNFINVRRTADILDESIRYASLQFTDMPITQSVIDTIVESVNQFIRKLSGDKALLGGECWFDPDRNPETQLAAGQGLFQYKFTPPPPLERITYESEITSEYLINLKGGN